MDSAAHHSVSAIDANHLLYGNYIGLQYVFKTPLDKEALSRAVAELIHQFPALSGIFIDSSLRIKTSPSKVALTFQRHETSIQDILKSSSRPQFIKQPKRRHVLKGQAPLSTFTLTKFEDGGMILSVAVSHVLTDAAGFHLLMKQLSAIYNAIRSDKPLPEFPYQTYLEVFEFGTQRSKAESLGALKKRGLPKPIPIKGLVGYFIKPLIIKAMDKSLSENSPVKIQLIPDDIARLKETVLTESGEDWISTNVALCAHFTSLMAKLSYGEDIKRQMQIGQLLDLRNRYFDASPKSQSNYVGNAILIHIDNAAFPDGLQNTSRGALARYFKQRQRQTTPKDVKDRLDLLSDCLEQGYTNPELDVKNPIISLNNQSKMPVYDIAFDEQKPLRIYPQDVGDNIMFFPAPDGGIEVYIRDIVNPRRQAGLLTPEWMSQIYNF